MSEESSTGAPGTGAPGTAAGEGGGIPSPQESQSDQAAPARPPAQGRHPRQRLRRTKLIVRLAVVIAGLTVLVVIKLVTSSPQGPHYASPHDACTLVKASTVATYAPGATIDRLPPSGPATPGMTGCDWGTAASTPFKDYVLAVNVTIFAMSSDAQGGFSSGVQLDRQDSLGTTQSVQQVKGLGEQATALFHGGPAAVDLYVWSGNAEIETTFADLGPVGPPPSSATILDADVAMAYDVLADLPR